MQQNKTSAFFKFFKFAIKYPGIYTELKLLTKAILWAPLHQNNKSIERKKTIELPPNNSNQY